MAPAILIAAGLALCAGGGWTMVQAYAEPQGPRDILAQRPLSGAAWLNLAAEDFDAHDGLTDASVRYLWLSQRATPNEGALMFGRSLLGLAGWRALPDSMKRSVARDLAGAVTYLPGSRPAQLKALFDAMSLSDRAQVRSLLRDNNVSDGRMNGIGL